MAGEQFKLNQKGLILVAIPLFFELVFISTLFVVLDRAVKEIQAADRAAAIVSTSNSMLTRIYASGLVLARYAALKDESMLTGFDRSIDQLSSDFDRLARLVAGQRANEQIVERSRHLADKLVTDLRHFKRMLEVGDSKLSLLAAKQYESKVESTLGEILSGMKVLLKQEQAVEKNAPESVTRSRNTVVLWLVAGIVANIFIAVATAMYFMKSISSRLGLLVDNTQRVVQGESLNPPIKGADEIAELDRSFHLMSERLTQAEAERRRVENMKQEILAMVSHDLRTPLMSVSGFLQLLNHGAYGELSANGDKKAQLVEAECRRLVSMINDLLDLEKLKSGSMEVSLKAVRLGQVIRRSIESVQPQAEDRGVILSFENSDALVAVDEERMIQVLVNLLSNAVKFSSAGSPVSVKAEKSEKVVRVLVCDEAGGIPEGSEERIFKAFDQGGAGEEKTRHGVGLGLAICSLIVGMHKGRMGVCSRYGVGSDFWFELPLPTDDD